MKWLTLRSWHAALRYPRWQLMVSPTLLFRPTADNLYLYLLALCSVQHFGLGWHLSWHTLFSPTKILFLLSSGLCGCDNYPTEGFSFFRQDESFPKCIQFALFVFSTVGFDVLLNRLIYVCMYAFIYLLPFKFIYEFHYSDYFCLTEVSKRTRNGVNDVNHQVSIQIR